MMTIHLGHVNGSIEQIPHGQSTWLVLEDSAWNIKLNCFDKIMFQTIRGRYEKAKIIGRETTLIQKCHPTPQKIGQKMADLTTPQNCPWLIYECSSYLGQYEVISWCKSDQRWKIMQWEMSSEKCGRSLKKSPNPANPIPQQRNLNLQSNRSTSYCKGNCDITWPWTVHCTCAI